MTKDKEVNNTSPSGIIPTTPPTVLTIAADHVGLAAYCALKSKKPTGIIIMDKIKIMRSIVSRIMLEARFLSFAWVTIVEE